MAARKTLLIVYHSFTDGTRQMAEAARAGATADEGCTARLLHAAQAGAPDVLAADGYLFATPENLAAMSGQLKAVAEPLIVCTHAQTPEAILAPKQMGADDLERCRALGEALAAGLALGIF